MIAAHWRSVRNPVAKGSGICLDVFGVTVAIECSGLQIVQGIASGVLALATFTLTVPRVLPEVSGRLLETSCR